MNYAVRYVNSFRHFETVNEVIFRYDNSIEKIVFLIQSTLKEPEQIGIIDLSNYIIEEMEDNILPMLLKIKKEHKNIKVIISFFEQRDFIPILQENEIEFIFREFAKSISIIAAMYNLGASEIYLAEDLCFNLPKLQHFRKKGLKFRIWPDIAQTAAGTQDIFPRITNFFVRPEDIDLYKKYVDTIEFMRDGAQLNAIYEVYRQAQWLGNLDLIILDLEDNIDNSAIMPYFGPQRLRCNRRCLWGECDVCDRTQELAKRFEENNIALIKKKKPMIIPKSIKERIEKSNESNINEEAMYKNSPTTEENINSIS